MSNWTYKGEDFTENTGDHYGFIYIITNKLTGKKYVGRKFFTAAGRKTVKGKKKKIRKESNWKSYYGSSVELLDDITEYGKENFDREILMLCSTRGECNYQEIKHQFKYNVLEEKMEDGSAAFYNSWLSCKVHKATTNTS